MADDRFKSPDSIGFLMDRADEDPFVDDFGRLIREGRIIFASKNLHPFVDVNKQDDNGMTPLHHAAAVGARSVVRMLVKSGRCNYLIQDKWGRYASDLAYEWGQDPAISRLLTIKQTQLAEELGVPACPTPKPPKTKRKRS